MLPIMIWRLGDGLEVFEHLHTDRSAIYDVMTSTATFIYSTSKLALPFDVVSCDQSCELFKVIGACLCSITNLDSTR